MVHGWFLLFAPRARKCVSDGTPSARWMRSQPLHRVGLMISHFSSPGRQRESPFAFQGEPTGATARIPNSLPARRRASLPARRGASLPARRRASFAVGGKCGTSLQHRLAEPVIARGRSVRLCSASLTRRVPPRGGTQCVKSNLEDQTETRGFVLAAGMQDAILLELGWRTRGEK